MGEGTCGHPQNEEEYSEELISATTARKSEPREVTKGTGKEMPYGLQDGNQGSL